MRSSSFFFAAVALGLICASSALAGRPLQQARQQFVKQVQQRLAARIGDRGPVLDRGWIVQQQPHATVLRKFEVAVPERGRELGAGAKPTWLATTTVTHGAGGKTYQLQRADGSRFTGRLAGRSNGTMTLTIDRVHTGAGGQRTLSALWDPRSGMFFVKQDGKTETFLGPRGYEPTYRHGDTGLMGGPVAGARLFNYLMRAVDKGLSSIAIVRPIH